MIDEWMYAEGDFDVNFTKKRELSLTDFEKKITIGINQVYKKLKAILVREKRFDLYTNTIQFVRSRVDLDLASFTSDIWSH